MARAFNGTNQSVVGSWPGVLVPISFACWIRPTSFSHIAVPYGVGSSGDLNGHCCLVVSTSGHPYVEVSSTGANVVDAISAVTIPLNSWSHVAAVATNGTVSIYVNGVNQGSNSYIGIISTAAQIGAGFLAALSVDFFPGSIAECAWWATNLTSAELQALALGVPPSRVRTSGLVHYWPLYGAASPEPDLSGGQRNGTVTGATLADHAPVGRYAPFPNPYSRAATFVNASGLYVPQRTLRGVGT